MHVQYEKSFGPHIRTNIFLYRGHTRLHVHDQWRNEDKLLSIAVTGNLTITVLSTIAVTGNLTITVLSTYGQWPVVLEKYEYHDQISTI